MEARAGAAEEGSNKEEERGGRPTGAPGGRKGERRTGEKRVWRNAVVPPR